MRVVIAGDYPAEAGMVVGGIQATIYYTLSALACEEKLDIQVITCEKREPAGRPVTEQHAYEIHDLSAPSRLPHTLTMMTVDRQKVLREIRQLAPDIVHAHGTATSYPWAAFASSRPVVITVHGLNGLEAKVDRRGGPVKSRLRHAIWRMVENACLRRATDIIVISPFVADYIRPLTRADMHPVENPVEPTLFTLPRRPVPGRILYVGSIQKRKGLRDLLHALHRLRDTHPEAHLQVAGSFTSAYRQYGLDVQRDIAELGLGAHVQLCGHLNRVELQAAYQQCALFCLPSYLEASPVVVAEAMAAACPIVATDIPSTSHLVVEGQTGLRFPAGNVDRLTRQLGHHMADPGTAAAMGRAARQEAERRFHPAVAATATRRVYEQMLS